MPTSLEPIDAVKDAIIQQAIAACGDALEQLGPDGRRTLIESTIARIKAEAAGDSELALDLGSTIALCLRTAQNIGSRVALRRGLKIAAIVASVIAGQLPALAGVVVAAIASFIDTDDVEEDP